MRTKEIRLLVTFPGTTDAMAMEAACRQRELPGRLIPLPGYIKAGCGMAWSAPPDAKDSLEKMLAETQLSFECFCLITV